ncbi:hypothetical protein E8E13_006972 [Curvularia kusanoi]|uniref:Uncharacterized protein n=1 Tax=Curvularia kusanoi TaxID=90978 RepID=A0A9P4TC89_CURKU|nr:hypothetical protein E8E13_006972 [Curvularia kusanoi]
MSHLLQFRSPDRLPGGIRSAPFVVFGINGTDITSLLPPLIPLKLVVFFAPALQKWVLPPPETTRLPRIDLQHSMCTPYIGIDIRAPIKAEGLSWILSRILQMGGRKVRKEMFTMTPDLETSMSIHSAWVALELPLEGLQGLHVHIQAQMMTSACLLSLQDMRALWECFPHDSAIVKTMGMRFMEANANMEYRVRDSFEILAWFQSTPDLCEFFSSLSYAPPAPTLSVEKEKTINAGYMTVGKKARRKSIERESARIVERNGSRSVSPEQKEAREKQDCEAMTTRLRRINSNDSLRSVDTMIWHPQSSGDDDLNDKNNHSHGGFGKELAMTLESIRASREIKETETSSSIPVPLTIDDETDGNAQIDDKKATHKYQWPQRRQTSRRNSLSLAKIERRIQSLQARQVQLVQEAGNSTAPDKERAGLVSQTCAKAG